MTLPNYQTGESDPGPSFVQLLRTRGLEPPVPSGDVAERFGLAHGTTCVAVKFSDGVVMAGDRRATSGHLISHRDIQKVFPADRHSGVAIAGAAGPAVEMVRLFQLQLEHYEKVEGTPLSLDGKANQLGQMIRNHLPAAMQGLAVVPIFAGYDLKRREGRLFHYDVTGGRYEERLHSATGSGSLHATTVIKLGYRRDIDADAATRLAVASLFQAADEDAATGGADVVRDIFPIVATITGDGYRQLDDPEVAEHYRAVLAEARSRVGVDADTTEDPR